MFIGLEEFGNGGSGWICGWLIFIYWKLDFKIFCDNKLDCFVWLVKVGLRLFLG